MGIRSGFFNSRNGDRRYDAQVFTDLFAKLMTNGIYATPATCLQVQATDPSGMGVVVAEGFGMINGYYALNDGDYSLTVDTAHGTYARKDRVVMRLNITNREIQLLIIKGTAAANPAAPLLVRDGTYYDLGLAIITVAANATAITPADILDTRQNATVCGTITGAVNSIDTTNLFAQYEAQWLLLKALCEQNQEAILAQFASLNTVQKVNNIAPTGIEKNVSLTLDNIPDGVSRKIAGVSGLLIQTGTVSYSSTITVSFQKAYASKPLVLVVPVRSDTSYINDAHSPKDIDITTTGFSFPVSGSYSTVKWVAIGTPAT